jgi:transposase
MPAPYSNDLRNKIILTIEGGKTKSQAARLFSVSTSFVSNLCKQYKETGCVQAKKIGGKRPLKITAEGLAHLKEWIFNNPSLTLDELSQQYEEHFGMSISRSTIDTTLKRNKITFKKKSV